MPEKTPLPKFQWQPILISVGIAVIGGYIGLVHQQVLRNTEAIDRLAVLQYERTYLVNDVENIKKRLASVEELSQRIPLMTQGIQAINQKLDRLIERHIPEK